MNWSLKTGVFKWLQTLLLWLKLSNWVNASWTLIISSLVILLLCLFFDVLFLAATLQEEGWRFSLLLWHHHWVTVCGRYISPHIQNYLYHLLAHYINWKQNRLAHTDAQRLVSTPMGDIVSQYNYSAKASGCCLKSVLCGPPPHTHTHGHISVYMIHIIRGCKHNTTHITVSLSDPSKAPLKWDPLDKWLPLALSVPVTTPQPPSFLNSHPLPTRTHLYRPLSFPVFKAKIKAKVYI